MLAKNANVMWCCAVMCCAVCVCVQGAPEGILERCTKARIAGRDTVELDDQMKADILDIVRRYGSGADTLRCLALAVIDDPTKPEDMDLEDAGNFVKYEVCRSCVCACVRACVCACVCTFVCTYIYTVCELGVCMHLCTCVYTWCVGPACVYICTYVCVCMYMVVCGGICTCAVKLLNLLVDAAPPLFPTPTLPHPLHRLT